jgi:hypothetical protein
VAGLSLLTLDPYRFRQARVAPKLDGARTFFRAAIQGLRNGGWREEVRTRCEDVVAGKALIMDELQRIRALVIHASSDDGSARIGYVFDEHERLRLLYHWQIHYRGTTVENLVLFAPGGEVLACDHVRLKVGSGDDVNLCWQPKPEPERPPKLDRAVQDALRDPARPKPRDEDIDLLAEYRDVDPRREFGQCKLPINPAQPGMPP